MIIITSSRGTGEAHFVFVFVLGILFTGVKDLLRSQVMSSVVDGRRLKSMGLWEVYSGMVLLVALLFRAHNLPTLACCLLIQTLMAQFIWKRLHYDAAQTTIMHYWFGQAFFYFQVKAPHMLFKVGVRMWERMTVMRMLCWLCAINITTAVVHVGRRSWCDFD